MVAVGKAAIAELTDAVDSPKVGKTAIVGKGGVEEQAANDNQAINTSAMSRRDLFILFILEAREIITNDSAQPARNMIRVHCGIRRRSRLACHLANRHAGLAYRVVGKITLLRGVVVVALTVVAWGQFRATRPTNETRRVDALVRHNAAIAMTVVQVFRAGRAARIAASRVIARAALTLPGSAGTARSLLLWIAARTLTLLAYISAASAARST
jgi:hypothetical protein